MTPTTFIPDPQITDPRSMRYLVSSLFANRTASFAAAGVLAAGASAATFALIGTIAVGSDLNSTANAFVQPQDPALSGGGRDQTLQFGDVLMGDGDAQGLDDLLIGRLGVDVLMGGYDDDVLVGGTEHFNPQNRDRAFGGEGEDIFLWSPGDGSDFFDGGPGIDTVVFGLMGELDAGQLVFRVSNDQLPGEVFVNPATGLPQMDVTNSPGFCEVLDDSTSATSATELDELGLDHLVRFFIRGINNSFQNGTQNTDNGLRVTLHLKDVEVLICTSPSGGQIEAYNLTTSPPTPLALSTVTSRLPKVGLIVQ